MYLFFILGWVPEGRRGPGYSVQRDLERHGRGRRSLRSSEVRGQRVPGADNHLEKRGRNADRDAWVGRNNQRSVLKL